MKMHPRSSSSLSKLLFSRYPFQISKCPFHPILTQTPQTQNAHFSLYPKPSNSASQFSIFSNIRLYSVDIDRAVDEINLKFAEAREEIETAMDSKETVYFNEEAECARDAVKEVLDLYEALSRSVPEKEKGVIQRSMGLKIEQLKAELEQLNE